MIASLRRGEQLVWLSGAALSVALLMVAGLVLLIVANALGYYWPHAVEKLTLDDGSVLVGVVTDREAIPTPGSTAAPQYRLQLKQANRDLNGADFIWVDEHRITAREQPPTIVVLERLEWGDFYGELQQFKDAANTVDGAGPSLEALRGALPKALETRAKIRELERGEIGVINYREERIRLREAARALAHRQPDAESARLDAEKQELKARYAEQQTRLVSLRSTLTSSIALSSVGRAKEVPLEQIVRFYQPNQMGFFAKLGLYLEKLWELLSSDPRESNTEGGLFPAIFGTVMMVVLMTFLVTPLGVIAALYLREYAKQGPFVSAVRIAVNNLAGVPSIVFGVFGVGFFIYFVGGGIDRLFFPEALPTPTFGTGGILWASLTLALLTVPMVIVATEEGLAAIPGGMREASLALGATKLETTLKVVIPAVTPSILTGVILAMARAAGEVAPLMITGVVKLAPSLPMDRFFPFVHLDRKFMHLGFHIYDVGFQSPNVDAARPMVYMTTLMLLAIVLILNLAAISLRNRLRKRFATSAV